MTGSYAEDEPVVALKTRECLPDRFAVYTNQRIRQVSRLIGEDGGPKAKLF